VHSYAAAGCRTGGAALHNLPAWRALVALALLRRRGLVASFFHLGRPGARLARAAMWRTSWLSREVIVLPAFMGRCAVRRGALGGAPVMRRCRCRSTAGRRPLALLCVRAVRLHRHDLRVPALPA
jgi:hypothetical protein